MPTYVALDFEATCYKPNPRGFLPEIIQFPLQLLDEDLVEREYFNRYVRPTVHPILSPFCTELTGITQGHIREGPEIQDALLESKRWLYSHVYNGEEVILLTYGNWDIDTCLRGEANYKKLRVPDFLSRWINVKKEFHKFANPGKRCGLGQALQHYGMTFEGRQHCGLADARNTTLLLREMIRRGYSLESAAVQKY